ncbi:helix-turn-helix domain-containing protein [Flavobacterium sp. SLB02]|jgi:transcriptional regulator with XRE-family HTH domain|uniref:helix-turn-helix domain-containing protein n=1 Tax=Flavobacterium sp. SLB02 TaxID=2665645 RepID=UPI0012A91D1B|nr:helix-turn-helix transcriptional regulator [Flavobacterium sp. SLB02]QGK73503.1 helix-turn-helix domain-containing protein [Flavobacterium sp. SLB02]
MLIGDKIKSIRELKNYTQEYIADQLGITQAGYSKIEKGKTSLSLEKLQQLALILEMPLENIIRFESHRYFNQESIIVKGPSSCSGKNFELVTRLYEEKIALLERLLCKTDQELQFYKEKRCCN